MKRLAGPCPSHARVPDAPNPWTNSRRQQTLCMSRPPSTTPPKIPRRIWRSSSKRFMSPVSLSDTLPISLRSS
ncbi:hypothetical protein EMPG_10168 [Blastomyces silverae]|uniref:Uncharacterized protein n=1 Tax=Blastomyces silverae TaxID=2060906 RepID=A0A0H1B609_9EURO|nr:hypothetical protein EMPG_10168 [Blastomyces silverae]